MGIAVGNEAETLLISYYELLERESRFLNLTAIKNPAEAAIKHFVDSLTVLKWVSFAVGDHLMDVGSGAGFPGIPLGIVQGGVRVVLLEAVKKKSNFQQRVIESLVLRNVEVIWGRAEECGREGEYRERFEWVVARAVAPLRELAEYMLPFARVGGACIAFKGPKGKEEVKSAVKAVGILGGRIAEVKEYRLPITGDERLLVFIVKESQTPSAYPRRAGIPRKKPL
ncbi:MAG: 16S rRNA (guanine(527)-N(7))-methyltransferase RsmG [Bacillota bacterium]